MGIKEIVFGLLLAALSMGSMTTPVQAQYEKKVVDISQLSCADLLRLSEDREPTITYMYGYVNGVRHQLVIKASKASETTDKVIGDCIQNPNVNLMQIFMQAFDDNGSNQAETPMNSVVTQSETVTVEATTSEQSAPVSAPIQALW